MVDTLHKGILATIIAVFVFLAGTTIEVLLTIWAFKKFGGCPMMDKHK